MTYPALLRLRAGTALLIQQRSSIAPEAVSDFLVSSLETGMCAVLLPDFAQTIANTGRDALFAEILESAEVAHEHESIRNFQGPAFYPAVKDGQLSLVANVRYAELTAPRWIQPREAKELNLRFGDLSTVTEATHPWLERPEDAFSDFTKTYDYFSA